MSTENIQLYKTHSNGAYAFNLLPQKKKKKKKSKQENPLNIEHKFKSRNLFINIKTKKKKHKTSEQRAKLTRHNRVVYVRVRLSAAPRPRRPLDNNPSTRNTVYAT